VSGSCLLLFASPPNRDRRREHCQGAVLALSRSSMSHRGSRPQGRRSTRGFARDHPPDRASRPARDAGQVTSELEADDQSHRHRPAGAIPCRRGRLGRRIPTSCTLRFSPLTRSACGRKSSSDWRCAGAGDPGERRGAAAPRKSAPRSSYSTASAPQSWIVSGAGCKTATSTVTPACPVRSRLVRSG
jgi:hypothetical protein